MGYCFRRFGRFPGSNPYFAALLNEREECETMSWHRFGVVFDSQAACRRGPWFVVVSQGDHRMNQCLRSLACVVAVAALALLPTELAAKSSHKASASKKTHEAKAGGKQRHAASKSRHGKHADARRKSKKQDDEPADKQAT